MLKHYAATVESYKVEDTLHDMYDGETPVVAIEVFGPPEAMRYDKREDAECGPWVIGPRDEVYAYAETLRFDWEVQYEISHVDE